MTDVDPALGQELLNVAQSRDIDASGSPDAEVTRHHFGLAEQRFVAEGRAPGRLTVIECEGEIAAAPQAYLRGQLDRGETRLSGEQRHQRAERADVGPSSQIMVVVLGDEGGRAVGEGRQRFGARLHLLPPTLGVAADLSRNLDEHAGPQR
jgi:hypothetical protein